MDTQKEAGQTADGTGDESLNTASTSGQQAGEHGHKKGGIHNNALYAAGMGRPATAQVDPHTDSSLANTGTNISYEGATAPGAGGSQGMGYTSGQSSAGSSINSDSDYDQTAIGKPSDKAEDDSDIAENTDTDEMNVQ